MMCPCCHGETFAEPIKGIAVCATCGASIVEATGVRATRADLEAHNDRELAILRRARAKVLIALGQHRSKGQLRGLNAGVTAMLPKEAR